jgi:hypothetical protein
VNDIKKGEPILYRDGAPVAWIAVMNDQSELARPLYDAVNGGPPRAWECLVCPHELTDKCRDRKYGVEGRVVVASEKAMRLHLVKKHGIEFQGNLFGDYFGDLGKPIPPRDNGVSTGSRKP